MSQYLRQVGINVSLATGIISSAISLPLGFADVRTLAAASNPAWLARWKQAALSGWLTTGAVASAVILWETRQRWAPAAGRAVRWCLGVLWRSCSSMVCRSTQRPPVVSDGPTSDSGAVRRAKSVHLHPPVELLGPADSIEVRPCPETAEKVRSALKALGMPGCEIIRHYSGPVVQVVQVRMTESVKATGVMSLATDISAFLGAKSVTIFPVVGAPGVLQVEIAGKETQKVSLRTLLEAGALRTSGRLPLAFALDTRGNPIICDLAALRRSRGLPAST